jgi:uncharacterized protein (TIGR00299 family) protein
VRIAYFDCIAGASGDMILGALVDAGLPIATLRERLAGLPLDGFDLTARRVSKHGFSATQVDVRVADDVPARRLPDIEAIVRASALPTSIQDRAVSIFQRLGTVEAAIHGVTLDRVHLHELGGVDTIVDVVGALVGLDALGVEQVIVSPLPLGRGWTRGAHGEIPLPAPATVALLKDVPVVGSPVEAETVTPTGAALLAALAAAFGPLPPMTLSAVGYGAGVRDLPIPNLLRVFIGDASSIAEADTEALVILETNLDDMNPEFYDHVITRLFDAGALDVFLSPLQMKKNRPANLLCVLCRPDLTQPLMELLFAETSTLGIRESLVRRHCLARAMATVTTTYGEVRVKVARWGNGRARVKPEYDDCRRLAEQHAVPLRDIYRAAEDAARHLEV